MIKKNLILLSLILTMSANTTPIFANSINEKLSNNTVYFDEISIANKTLDTLKKQQNKQLKEIESKSQIDSLTQIYNRKGFELHVQNCLCQNHSKGMLVALDVDNFKSINDNYGHSVGDIVLQKIAKKIVSCVRGTDAVVRYGGDEFAVIFYDMPSSVFERKLEIIRNHVNTLVLEDHPEIQISISVGGAYGRGQVKEIFKIADKMMYQSKSKKNQVTVCFLNENKEEN